MPAFASSHNVGVRVRSGNQAVTMLGLELGVGIRLACHDVGVRVDGRDQACEA